MYADDRIVVVCPFWSGTPYQMLVLPRNHSPHLYKASASDLAATGRAIQLALASLRAVPSPGARLSEVAYNVMFHSSPYRVSGDYHWHAHVLPKVTTRGGF